jgi:hypothetical protein
MNYQLIGRSPPDPLRSEGMLRIGFVPKPKVAKVANAASVFVIPPSDFLKTLAFFCLRGTVLARRQKLVWPSRLGIPISAAYLTGETAEAEA